MTKKKFYLCLWGRKGTAVERKKAFKTNKILYKK